MSRKSKETQFIEFFGRPIGFVVKLVIYVVLVLVMGGITAILMWQAALDVLGLGKEDVVRSVTIPTGFTTSDVADALYDAHLIEYKTIFKLFAKFGKVEEKVAAGTYELRAGVDYIALVSGMSSRSPARVEVTVSLPEGFTLAQMFARFEDEGVCDADLLWEAASKHEFDYWFLDNDTLGDKLRLEGFLFPDTYNFYLNSTPVQVLSKLLREFDNKFNSDFKERLDESGYTVHEMITLASMVEREAGSDEERSRIAAVIFNRLARPSDFPFLQIDATIFYAIAGTDNAFSVDLDSPYNTYNRGGLPPTPIANPGLASIEAVLYPDTTNEYYYALNKSGTHNFFRTLDEHLAFVASDEFARN